ncbi:MAG TPA: DUF2797 domain-containing protein, partial [Ktedonobacterales bacterium]
MASTRSEVTAFAVGRGAAASREGADVSTYPPADQPVQLTGYTWRSGGLELLWRVWPHEPPPAPDASAASQRWPLTPGMTLSLTAARPGAPGERRCTGYHPPAGGPPLLCPEWQPLPPGSHSQCDLCMRREGRLEVVTSDGSRPPTGPSAAYLRSAHEVYLAAFAPDLLKVGVSGAGRAPLRVLEQGAPAALVIGRADDGMAARRLEHALGLAGVRERVPVRTKLRLLYPPPSAPALLAVLTTALDRLSAALPGGWPAEVERLDPPQPLDNTPTLGLATLDAAPIAAPGPPAGAIHG